MKRSVDTDDKARHRYPLPTIAASRTRSHPTMMQLKRYCRAALAQHGVAHYDLCERNMMWCKEREALVLIDFEHTVRVVLLRCPMMVRALAERTTGGRLV